ncbi:MAG TPA: aminoglycoside phosphotransferase family protein [Anaerolineales bacterium]|nr:aminoglycoside phosphotransferase family protein [Anaerolineales bacterium]
MEKGPLIGAGRTAEVYAWGQDRILKLYQDWMAAPPIEREFAITRAAREAGLPVPAADELVQVDGRLGIVFERIHGVSMLKVLESQPWRLPGIARQLGELHAHMHACTLPPGTYTQREQIEKGLEWAKDLTEAEMSAIRAILAGLPEGQSVCHGDFHPDNVLLTDHGPIIIDWMTGTRGHPLADVARTELLFSTGGLPPRISPFMKVVINLSRSWIYRIYLRRYLQLHPAGPGETEAWRLPLLAARLFEVENYPDEKELILGRIRAILAGPRSH